MCRSASAVCQNSSRCLSGGRGLGPRSCTTPVRCLAYATALGFSLPLRATRIAAAGRRQIAYARAEATGASARFTFRGATRGASRATCRETTRARPPDGARPASARAPRPEASAAVGRIRASAVFADAVSLALVVVLAAVFFCGAGGPQQDQGQGRNSETAHSPSPLVSWASACS